MNTKISVIIPTFKRNEYLKQALNSVLRQKQVDFEVIIVDDDPTNTIGDSFFKKEEGNIKYLQNKNNIGPGGSRKRGLFEANGTFVIFMDDDDYYTDDFFFDKAIKYFSLYQDLSFVGFASRVFDQGKNKSISINSFEKNGKISNNNYLRKFGGELKKPTSTFTTVFNKKKLYDAKIDDVNMLNDTVIYLRALLSGDAYLVNKVIGNYRIHLHNITRGISEQFILENLLEKEKISKLLPFGKIKKEYWLYRQAWMTIDYFLNNNNENTNNGSIVNWVNQLQFPVNYVLYFKIKLFEFTAKRGISR